MKTGFEVEERHLGGGVLDPQAERILQEMAEADAPPFDQQTPEEARAAAIEFVGAFIGEPVAIRKAVDQSIAVEGRDLPIRVYTPSGEGPFPVLIYYHGGGWVICNLDTHDDICRRMCQGAGAVVIAVDYRLAPEHKFPAAMEDAFAVLQWAHRHAADIGGDPERIAVSGDSAGGNLAAVTALKAREADGPALLFQLLIYPVTDISRLDTPSYLACAEGYFLTRGMMAWFRDHYVPSAEEQKSPYASPLLAVDLSGLPPALVITAEFDPLRDEGEAYAKRLDEAGVAVRCIRYNGLIHAFWGMTGAIDQSQYAHEEAARALRECFDRAGKSE